MVTAGKERREGLCNILGGRNDRIGRQMRCEDKEVGEPRLVPGFGLQYSGAHCREEGGCAILIPFWA